MPLLLLYTICYNNTLRMRSANELVGSLLDPATLLPLGDVIMPGTAIYIFFLFPYPVLHRVETKIS
jgi:hypothetical protein